MKFETEAGTDIAMIGIWDADASGGEIPFKCLIGEISKDGKEGKLLRVDTGADGGYSICVVSTLEELRTFRLDAYAKIEHDFFLKSETGAFIAGGLEDYRNGTPQITSKDNLFKLEPGAFKVHAYVHNEDEEQISKQVEAKTGVEELRYYQTRNNGLGIAIGAIGIGAALAFLWSWWALLAALLMASGVLIYFLRLNSSDARVQRVDQAFRIYEQAHPTLIFHFESVQGIGESRGFFHLDEVLQERG